MWTNFNRWCSSADVADFEWLHDLIVLEQLKKSPPLRVAMYVSKQRANTVLKAAELVDDTFVPANEWE